MRLKLPAAKAAQGSISSLSSSYSVIALLISSDETIPLPFASKKANSFGAKVLFFPSGYEYGLK